MKCLSRYVILRRQLCLPTPKCDGRTVLRQTGKKKRRMDNNIKNRRLLIENVVRKKVKREKRKKKTTVAMANLTPDARDAKRRCNNNIMPTPICIVTLV